MYFNVHRSNKADELKTRLLWWWKFETQALSAQLVELIDIMLAIGRQLSLRRNPTAKICRLLM